MHVALLIPAAKKEKPDSKEAIVSAVCKVPPGFVSTLNYHPV
jgi:hypothetical protein